MRIDHHTYQKATTTAITGLLLQLAIAATLLIFGLVANSSAFVFASLYVWTGGLIWLGLAVLFYQQKMQVIEELEESNLAGTSPSSMFDSDDAQIRPAAKRLRLIHKWFIPSLSLCTAASLVVIGILVLHFMKKLNHHNDLEQTFLLQTGHIGWALAVALGLVLVSFIYSRFVAGMGKIPAWTNLRGGSAWMVGNTILLLALTAGLSFRFFGNDQILIWICWGIPIFMFAVAAEIAVNFVLNLYRPRLHGESPRPAFDSKTLSMFASPDSIVRSINEAVNYQFGFDVTSSWGYQLMLRSVTGLLVLGLIVLLTMSSMIVVEPTQQAVRLRQGALVSDIYKPGIMFKLPWPIETAQIYDLTRVRELPLTFSWKKKRNVILWTDDYNKNAVAMPKPFIVNEEIMSNESGTEDVLSLIDVRAVLRYRISENGLLDWITFGSDEVDRRSRMTQREMAIYAFSQNTLTNLFQSVSLEDIIGADRGGLSLVAKNNLQKALDAQNSGVEVISLDLPLVAPTAKAAQSFEELSVAMQGEERLVMAAQGHAENVLTSITGNPDLVDSIVSSVADYNIARTKWNELRRDTNSSLAEIKKSKDKMDQAEALAVEIINKGNGSAAAKIRDARVKKWTGLMDTWASASRVTGQVAAFKAAPNLYKQRMYMSVLARKMPAIKKYLIGIEPSRVRVDIELKNINPLLNFADALENEDEGN